MATLFFNIFINLFILLLGISADSPLLSMENSSTPIAVTTPIVSEQASENDDLMTEQQLIDNILMGEGINPDKKLIVAIAFGLTEQLPVVWEQSSQNNTAIKVSTNNNNLEHIISPLLYALSLGDLAVIERLITLGAHFTENDYKLDSNPLCFVATQGHTHLLEYIISLKPTDLNQPNNNNMTPLMGASQLGRLSTIDKLLELGARTDILTNNNSTPLTVAIIKSQVSVVKRLLERDPNMLYTTYGRIWQNPLDLAVNNNSPECAKEILKIAHQSNTQPQSLNTAEAGRPTPLMILIQEEDTENALSLIQLIAQHKDLSVNYQEPQLGYSALHIAAGHSDPSIVKALLQLPFLDVNPIDLERKCSPIEIALRSNLPAFNILLNDKRIDIARENSKSLTLLEIALNQKNIPAIEAIIDKQRSLEPVIVDKKKSPSSLTSSPGYTKKIIENCLTQAGMLYHQLSEKKEDRTQLQRIITNMLLLLGKTSEAQSTALRKLALNLVNKEHKNILLAGIKGLELYTKELNKLEINQTTQRQAEKIAQELIEKEQQEKSKITKSKKKKKPQAKTQSTTTTIITPQKPITTATSSTITTPTTTIDPTPQQQFAPVKAVSKNQRRKEAQRQIPAQLEDTNIFAGRGATLHVIPSTEQLNKNYQNYLHTYERHERIIEQQNTLCDYHTFSADVERFWACHAHCSQEDLTTAQSNAFIAKHGVAYTKKLTYTIDGFINNTLGKFEIVLLAPNEHEINKKPLCIHRFFRPAFAG